MMMGKKMGQTDIRERNPCSRKTSTRSELLAEILVRNYRSGVAT